MDINKVEELLAGSTFGAEMEVPNWHTSIDIGDMGTLCDKEFEIINYKGIGNDPKREYNLMGAEIQVRYAHSEEELVERIETIWETIGNPEITASPTLHVHIRPPELLKDENVDYLKQIMNYTFKWAPELLTLISPLPPMSMFNHVNYPNPDELAKIKDAYVAKYRHRWGTYTLNQMKKVLSATTFEDTINSLAVKNKQGKPSWNIHTRGTFNFAKLRETDGQTLEFRMWSLTKDPEEIRNMVAFPKEFIKCALLDLNPMEYFKDWKFPPVPGKEQMNYYAAPHFVYTDGRKCKRKEIIAYLKEKLLAKEILISDLGYPPFWKKELGEAYYSLEEYSKEQDK